MFMPFTFCWANITTARGLIKVLALRRPSQVLLGLERRLNGP
jgi:hypothetical protein